jgi:L-threonylcarbamoyladenylate synthase
MNAAPRIVRPASPDPDDPAILEAARRLRAGDLAAFPTETVYGLGANALDEAAVQRVFEAKGRPANNPLIVHVPNAAAAAALVTEWRESAERLAALFWPGPLTIVLPRSERVPPIVTAGGPTVALRSPAHPVARALLVAAGIPVAAPSANRSGRISPTTALHVARSLGDRIGLILDGGPCPGGIESTVLDLSGDPPVVLRAGPVTAEQIARALGTEVRHVSGQVDEGCAQPSPGMLARHYAPSVPLVVALAGEARAIARKGDGILLLGVQGTGETAGAGRIVEMPAEPGAYASRLYAALHDLEDAAVDRIVVEMPPDLPQWRAVRDRLLRAATEG